MNPAADVIELVVEDIPIVAVETAAPADDDKASGVASVSPYALSWNVLPLHATESIPENATVEKLNTPPPDVLLKITFGDNVIELSHADVT